MDLSSMTVAELKRRAKETFERVCKQPLRTVTPAHPDWNFMISFVGRHHRWYNRTDEITHFVVMEIRGRNGGYNLVVSSEDNVSGDVVSYHKCAEGKERYWESNDFDKLQSAMRDAVQYQIDEFKRVNPVRKCARCDVERADVKYHVDHIEQFTRIVGAFLQKPPLNEIPSEFDGDEGNIRFVEKDEEFAREFARFHEGYANNLRWMCATCNVRRKRNRDDDEKEAESKRLKG